MAKEFTDANFEQEVLKSEKPVLVDFFTPPCGPCRKLAPTIDKLAEEYQDVVIGKCDVSENTDSGVAYRVNAVPCLVFFKAGKEVDRHLGFLSEEALKSWIERNK